MKISNWLQVVKNPNSVVHPMLMAIAQKRPIGIVRAELRAASFEVNFPNPFMVAFIAIAQTHHLNFWKLATRYHPDPWHRRPDENGEAYPLLVMNTTADESLWLIPKEPKNSRGCGASQPQIDSVQEQQDPTESFDQPDKQDPSDTLPSRKPHRQHQQPKK